MKKVGKLPKTKNHISNKIDTCPYCGRVIKGPTIGMHKKACKKAKNITD
jgi:hypothetical protein